jgi:two-component system chemotaxis response regulator CheY
MTNPQKEIKFLIVDDMGTLRKLINKQLNEIGHQNVTQGADGEAAWNLLEQHFNEKKPFDFIISDWNMPKMTGIELLKKVRGDERFNKLPFLMLTAETEKEKVADALASGVSNYILKPFTKEILMSKIDKIINKK